jgi:hypothetical protein
MVEQFYLKEEKKGKTYPPLKKITDRALFQFSEVLKILSGQSIHTVIPCHDPMLYRSFLSFQSMLLKGICHFYSNKFKENTITKN